jgi:hypothetical protein
MNVQEVDSAEIKISDADNYINQTIENFYPTTKASLEPQTNKKLLDEITKKAHV